MAVIIILLVIIAFVGLIVLFLPKILNALGLHAPYDGKTYQFSDKKALIITTSQATFTQSRKATGVYASEMTVPYYEFSDSDISVDIASINGGKVPIEPMSLKYPVLTPEDKRYLNDEKLKNKVDHSLKIDDIDISDYDLIFIAGGWGAAYDLGQSDVLGEKITDAYKQGKIIGSVCHGALGLIQAKKEDGTPLVAGKKVTAVTDKQIRELMITKTPLHPETELRKKGAKFESEKAIFDLFANKTVVDENLVTGQNQNAGAETAQKMMALLTKIKDKPNTCSLF